MIGTGNFMQLSIGTVIATAASIISLNTLPKMFGLTVWLMLHTLSRVCMSQHFPFTFISLCLTYIHLKKGVWMSFGVFNVCRLAGVWIHQTKNGPLSERELAKVDA